MKLYPNPVIGGNEVFLDLNSKLIGDYKLDIIDASGKIIKTQQISIAFKSQTISVSTSAQWPKGIYWIRVSGPGRKNIQQAKLVIR